MSIKGTCYYRKMIAAIRSRYPDDNLLLPSKLFRSVYHWTVQNEAILSSSDLFILIGDKHGWIGKGGMTDLEYFKQFERPVLFMTPDGNLHKTFELRERRHQDSWQYAYETRIQGYYGDPREKQKNAIA